LFQCLGLIFVLLLLEGPGAMVGSAIIGGFILGMIEGVSILLTRYNQMLMPQPGFQGKDISLFKKTNY
jgi:hypothetical protein